MDGRYSRDDAKISIHSPLRGETGENQKWPRHRHISIHSPLRGETGMWTDAPYKWAISIHSPLRGETVR